MSPGVPLLFRKYSHSVGSAHVKEFADVVLRAPPRLPTPQNSACRKSAYFERSPQLSSQPRTNFWAFGPFRRIMSRYDAVRPRGRRGTIMSVKKFRNVEELNQPIWRQAGDPQLFRAMSNIWAFAQRTNPRKFPPGVRKFRSIAEMKRGR